MDEEIVKVYTKYDTPAMSVTVPRLNRIVAHSLSDDTELLNLPCMVHFRYEISKIEYGLEGVRYFHYAY